MSKFDLPPESIYHLAKGLNSYGRNRISGALDFIEKQGLKVQDDIVVVGDIVLKKKDRLADDPEIIIIEGLNSVFYLYEMMMKKSRVVHQTVLFDNWKLSVRLMIMFNVIRLQIGSVHVY